MADNGVSTNKNVVLAKPLSVVGGVFVGPTSSVPTDADTELPSTFKTVGFLTTDAVTRTIDREIENIYAWGGYLLAASVSESSCSVEFQCAEYLNEEAQRLLYGTDNVTVSGTGTEDDPKTMTIHGKIGELPNHSCVVIEVRSENAVGRIVYPDFQVTEYEDVALTETEPTVVPVKGLAFVDSTGAAFHEYWIKTPDADAGAGE